MHNSLDNTLHYVLLGTESALLLYHRCEQRAVSECRMTDATNIDHTIMEEIAFKHVARCAEIIEKLLYRL